MIVAYGTFETPEFQRQSRDFAAAVKAAGKPLRLLVGEGYNHFEMPEDPGESVRSPRPGGAGADESVSGKLSARSTEPSGRQARRSAL